MGLWTTEQAAQYLNLHPVTLRDKARLREVPAMRMGRFWRYRREELDAWMAAGCPGVDELGRMVDPASGETP